jgi:uncharacterized protein YbcC (UPF0753/DUF2309 family)
MGTLIDALSTSQKLIAEYWPLQSFIATNPLWDCAEEKFDTQLQKIMTRRHDILYCQKLAQYQFQSAEDYVRNKTLEVLTCVIATVNKLSFEKQRELNIYNLIVQHLPNFEASRGYIKTLRYLVEQLDIKPCNYTDYFEAIFIKTYGFSSLIKWMNNHPDNPWLYFDFPCEAILVIWLSFELSLKNKNLKHYKNTDTSQTYKNFDTKKFYANQLVNEKLYQEELIAQLNLLPESATAPVNIQAIFCIDTRSEPLRRALEQEATIQTFGFAGFFGFAFQCQQEKKISLQCPALLSPRDIVKIVEQKKSLLKIKSAFTSVFKKTKKQILASFSFFEIFGFWHVVPYLTKTFFPLLSHKLAKPHVLGGVDDLDVDISNISAEVAAESGFQMLNTIGLTDNFAEKIVICGHQSISTNNPYAAALDCGACGGNSGLMNATVAAKCLNNPSIRALIKEKGITIPDSTLFIAACHNTTYDAVKLYGDYPEINQLFANACRKVIQEKQQRYPMLTNVKRRQFDWAELVPEYGLVNNAALIIGPRWVTEQSNLQGRVFLHSYDKEQDQDGEILQSIMLAPMIVAHWINMQYYFSTISPDLFGAGNKALHNIIPGIGVMEGNFSDLKIGLPQQSIFYRGEPLHTPQRLCVVIYANYNTVIKIIYEHQALQQLVANEWLQMYCLKGQGFSKIHLQKLRVDNNHDC